MEIELRIAYYKGELAVANPEDGLDILLLQRSIRELLWVLGKDEK